MSWQEITLYAQLTQVVILAGMCVFMLCAIAYTLYHYDGKR